MLLRDLYIFLKQPLLFYCDNLSAISLASNLMFHALTKHIEVEYHFIRKRVVRWDLQVHYVTSRDQVAGIFTRGLTSTRFQLLRSKLVVTGVPSSLRGTISQCDMEKFPPYNIVIAL